jgi:outer membrane protein TolC
MFLRRRERAYGPFGQQMDRHLHGCQRRSQLVRGHRDEFVLEPVELPMEDYLQAALANRPEIKSLQDRLQSNEMVVRSEFAGYLPSVSTSASYNWYKEDHADFLNNSNVTIAPAYQSSRDSDDRKGRQARAAVFASKYRVEDAKNDILNQVGVSYIAIATRGQA